MTTWTPYPKAEGEFAIIGTLILTARPSGAWSVHDAKGNKGSRSSSMAPIIGPVGIEAAKTAAEKAANEMING